MGWGSLNPFRAAQTIVKEVAKAPGDIVATTRDITGGIAEAVEDVGKTAKDFLSTPAGQIAMAYFLPGAGAALASQLELAAALEGTALAQAVGTEVAAKAVGTAVASAALQTAQGVPLETAVQNAAVNATAATGSPYAANYVGEVFKNMSPGAVNALTSAGVSAGATLAKGGNAEDTWKNAVAAAGASGLSPEIGRTAATGLATYAATGDALKAATAAAAAESGGKPKPPPETPAPTETPPTAEATPTSEPAPAIEDIKVSAPREQQPVYVSDLPSKGEVKITATREEKPTLITDIPASVTEKTDTTQPTTKEAKDTTQRVGENLFVFSGQYPTTSSPLSRALGTDLQAAGTTASPTTGLTSYRAEGEIEGESGINRENVWNEASLRLKDALGL